MVPFPTDLALCTLLLSTLALSRKVANITFGTVVRLDLTRITNDYSFFGDIEADISSRSDEGVIAYRDPAYNHCITPEPNTIADQRYAGVLTAVALPDYTAWREAYVIAKDSLGVDQHISMVIDA